MAIESARQRRVLITGANRGIGLTLAKHYKATGWNVVAAVRNPAAASEVHACILTILDVSLQLHALQVESILTLDVSNEESIHAAACTLGADVPIDLLINNAGVLTRDSLASASKAELLRQFEINAVGPFLVARAFLPNLERAVATSVRPQILANVSSIVGSMSLNTTGQNYGYRSSKAALNSLTKSLSVDLGARGICCLLLHPGYVQTDMTDHRGDMDVHESIAGLAAVLAKATFDDNATFFHTNGSVIPW
ncbi:hypothetical protein DYB28_005743 [Aphanomyces astaci]|uniref:Short chain dehydrogenase n=1 Tax=Aphanomyces astaci TaxID=112090 RepID=A0A9X8DUM8_APHAT|nr:hypothetical protein DYB28_005743 [Aphanomyces astaci]